ncbi:myosin-G heavy chain-like [Oppia nitens]|uniref:myosin-G heavy chain-like n=1 Tax=Oppia nitens TaxID=1686743 RepID=UPI0023DC66B4|nr:myosin-G heavy chain-like [Oppia nitens]
MNNKSTISSNTSNTSSNSGQQSVIMPSSSASSVSKTTATGGLNASINSFVPLAAQWQGNNLSYMPSPMNQMAVQPPPGTRPPMWSMGGMPYPPPPTYGHHPYYGPQMGPPMGPPPPPPHNSHQMHCCYHYDHNCSGGSGGHNNWSNNGGGGHKSSAETAWLSHKDSGAADTNSSTIIESITEIKDDMDMDLAPKVSETQRQLKQMKASYKTLKTRYEERSNDLMANYERFLKINEKLAIDYIRKYETLVKEYGVSIRDECNRFVKNPDMTKKLEPIVEQMKQCLKRAGDERKRIEEMVKNKRDLLMKKNIIGGDYDGDDDDLPDFDDIDFTINPLPDLPELLKFYKSILDEIPDMYLADMSKMQRSITMMANININNNNNNNHQQSINHSSMTAKDNTLNKSLLFDNNCLPFPSPSSASVEHSLAAVSKSLFVTAPTSLITQTSQTADQSLSTSSGKKMSDIFTAFSNSTQKSQPINIFSSLKPSAKTTDNNSNNNNPMSSSSATALELTFPTNHSPVDSTFGNKLLDSTPLASIGINSSIHHPVMPINDLFSNHHQKQNDLPAIGEPLIRKAKGPAGGGGPEADSIRAPRSAPDFGQKVIQTKNNNNTNHNSSGASVVSMASVVRPSSAAATESSASSAAAAVPKSSSSSTVVLNQAQSKLLAKLREKYPNLSADILVDCMAQTKAQLISTGDNPKGFTGLKVSEIITKISNYIDRNVSLMNKMSRISGPLPVLKSMNGFGSGEYNNNNNNNGHTIMANNNNDSGGGGNTIEPPKSWNKIINKLGSNDDNVCSICFDMMTPSKRYETECRHYFHQECITNWIRREGSCPVCRSLVLPPEEFPVL